MEIKGRHIDDLPFIGLMECLCGISILCHIAGDAERFLTKDEMLAQLSLIAEKASEALAFAGATRDEIHTVSTCLMQEIQATRARAQ
jgi:hypothetical protein